MSKYEFTIKETMEHYKEKGYTDIVLCMGDPLTGLILYELREIELERFYELSIGRYQASIETNKAGQSILLINLVVAQLQKIYPDYKQYIYPTEFKSSRTKQYKMFDGTVTAITKPPVGYCHYLQHCGNVSKHMMDQHSCLCKNGKPCPHFEKYITHFYWIERETIKARKKQKKAML